MKELSVLFEASEIVRANPMNMAVGHLKSCAERLHEAYDMLKISCTRSAAIEFNAAFARVVLAMERVQGTPPRSPVGGDKREGAMLAAL